MERQIYIPPGGPPRVASPSPEIYAQMGEANIFAMLEDFYRELEKSPLRAMFPKDMVKASQKSAAFFVGLLGGPPLYHQRYGNPMMRARHMPFVIDEAARQEWLACFNHVLDHAVEKYNFPAEHLEGFRNFLVGFSSWMVNTAPHSADSTEGLELFGRG
jgi:hemoglobin